MNGYNILVVILACVVLGVSIWAFVTRCNTDKFGEVECDGDKNNPTKISRVNIVNVHQD